MKWIITEDHVNGKEELPTAGPNWETRMVPVTTVGKGLEVGRNTTDKLDTDARVAEYADGLPFEFRLLDDDMNVYFVGRCGDLDQADGDEAFEPLDCVGKRYGAVQMEYRRFKDQEWEML